MRFSPLINRFERPDPCASNAGIAEVRTVQLQEELPKRIDWVEAETKPNRYDNRAQLHQLVGKATILLARMGDGGLHDTLAAFFDAEAPPDIFDNVTILPVGEGSKNDVAQMLLGRDFRDPLNALQRGRVARVHPLKFTLEPDENPDPYIFHGLYSAGINLAGEIMMRVNSRQYRQKQAGKNWLERTIEEVKVGWEAIGTASSTKSGYNNPQNTKVNLMIANGDRAAGGQLKFPVQLEQTGFFVASTNSHELPELILRSGKIVPGLGDLMVGPDSRTEIYVREPTPAQVDGEDFMLPPGRLTVEIAENSVKFVTTKPKRNLR